MSAIGSESTPRPQQPRRRCSFSHHSAAALHGLPSIGEWPLAVHVTDTDSNGGRSGGRRCVHRSGPSPETVVVDGLVVTALARTLADMTIAAPWESSVPMLDAALRRAAVRPRSTPSLITAKAVLDEIDAIAPVRGRTRAGSAVRFSDARSANAGESLSRVRMCELGFEIPELQVRFDGVLGSHAVVDFFWPRVGLVGEFDGRHKYTRSMEVSGLDPATVVFREKQREDALRRLGLSVIRWDWPLLFRPAEFARLLLEAGVPRAAR